MHIGIDGRAAKWYRGTGIGTYTYQLIKCLNDIDFLNDYLLFIPEKCHLDIPFNKNFKIKNITENITGNFWDEINIPNILKDKDIELYHVPQNGIGLPKDKKCPFVITLHDVIPYKMPETVSDIYLKLFTENLPKLIPLCDGIITVSNYSKNDIAETFNFPKEKIFVTYLAAESIYAPLNKVISKSIIKHCYGIDGDFVLYVGGFSPRKNIIGIIEAFNNLCCKFNKDLKLVIAGKQGKSYELYKSHAEKLNIQNKVIFPGFVKIDHMPYLYNSAELFIYPSFYEGFGLPPIEAMASGTPVIASNITSVPEIVNDSAFLVDPHDVDSMCNAMYSILSDESLKSELITKGLLKALSLNWNSTAKSTIAAYNKIMHYCNK